MDTEVLRDRPLVHVRVSDSLELMKDIGLDIGHCLAYYSCPTEDSAGRGRRCCVEKRKSGT